MKHVASRGGRTKSALWTILGILAELMLTAAAICALYIAWQMWWTGVQSEHNQIETRQSVSWSDPGKSGNVTVAKAQQGDPPVQPQSATEGELIAQIYIPRFGSQWQRNLVEGTDLTQLNKHGLGHYTDSQMPGQVGNFAFAGHRNGYGQPLGDVDKLQEGDPIIVRTQDYWYVYHYTSYKIVLPTQTEVVAANPENPGAAPTKRMLTMTTCEPKYSTPTHRWISYAEFSYWAKVADGIPQELASQNANGTVKFVNNEQSSFLSSIDTLKPWIFGALAAYVIIFISAAVAWRWPYLADVRAAGARRPISASTAVCCACSPACCLFGSYCCCCWCSRPAHPALNGCSRGLRRISRHCRRCRITRPSNGLCRAFAGALSSAGAASPHDGCSVRRARCHETFRTYTAVQTLIGA